MQASEIHRRPAAVAGTFYPAQAAALGRTVDALLNEARRERVDSGVDDKAVPKALIVPHAGYVYSGPIAASAWCSIPSSAAKRIERVVLIGPAHRVFLDGLAAPGVALLATPLGDMTVDTAALEALVNVPAIPAALALEHSLEVQLPFIQRLLPRARIVPLVVGNAAPGEVARVIEALWGDERTLIAISSDLSHYLPYGQARAMDEGTARRILGLEQVASEEACGAAGVNGLLEVARSRGLRARLVDLRNSGDTAGGREQVVGYGAFAFYEPEPA